jgi:hypothetical protein
VREKAAILLAIRWRVDRLFDAPIVRQIERAPGCVVETRLFGRRFVAQMKAPAGIEWE